MKTTNSTNSTNSMTNSEPHTRPGAALSAECRGLCPPGYAPPASTTPDAALLVQLLRLLERANRGEIAGEAEVLGALFNLLALHLEGAARAKSLEVAAWYMQEHSDGDLGGPSPRFGLTLHRPS